MAQPEASRYNRGVSSTRSLTVASLLALGVALLTLVPYILASRLAPAGHVFSGFLVNPIDGFSYLAKMREGTQGSWLFQLPYAAEPGPPALLFTFYILLGHLASWLDAPALTVFHGARVLAITSMGVLSFLFLRRAISEPRWVWMAYVLVLFGAGVGWLTGPFGLLASDLMIPESIPLAGGLVNPHFPLATGLVAAAGALALRPPARGWSVGLGLAIGVALSGILPFAAASILTVLAVWLVVEGWLNEARLTLKTRILSSRTLLAFGLAVGALPWITYDYWLTRNHVVLAAWNAQNQTPSPSPWAYLAGFGLVLALAVVGGLQSAVRRGPEGRLLITWVLVNMLLLYAPFNLQRRFSLALFLPLAALAAFGLRAIVTKQPRLRWLTSVVVLLSLPSNLLVAAAGVSLAASGSPENTMTSGEADGYFWAAEHFQGSPLVLAATRTGNRLPAYADCRVLIGHPFETPDAAIRQARVEELYGGMGEAGWLDQLRQEGISYVVLGPYEDELITGAASPNLPIAFQSAGFTVYSVPQP
ncbi:MAG: hypothetical protein WBR18_14005 [Anaerolineales bacterium]